jgi:2-polyprenyl-6-methoxyphenol hydroxylase-like FAD-dependent oxidoreductase
MTSNCELCIVGGGPAGMMAGLLFARAGVHTIVLEKHGDFLRDFRGDTVHPSTLRLFSELGLLDELLLRPHNKVYGIGGFIGDRHVEIADFSHFDRRWNFTALMPQWEFLDFVADQARAYPNFHLMMNAEATGLIEENGRYEGVVYRHEGEQGQIRARLVIAADGRQSILRGESELPLRTLGAPMDVFWFRVPRKPTPKNETSGFFVAGRIMVLLDRGNYWQCAYVFPKGSVDAVRARGLDRFREEVAQVAPALSDQIDAVTSWDDIKLLTVALDRLECWHKPGLLVIGDAAHAMSPIGGVGINVAIQDAVAAANLLALAMANGEAIDPLLHKVRERRLLQVRVVQRFQKLAQDRIVTPLLGRSTQFEPPLPLRMLNRFPLLRRIPAAFLGFGPRAEHVRSPEAVRPATTEAIDLRPRPSRLRDSP